MGQKMVKMTREVVVIIDSLATQDGQYRRRMQAFREIYAEVAGTGIEEDEAADAKMLANHTIKKKKIRNWFSRKQSTDKESNRRPPSSTSGTLPANRLGNSPEEQKQSSALEIALKDGIFTSDEGARMINKEAVALQLIMDLNNQHYFGKRFLPNVSRCNVDQLDQTKVSKCIARAAHKVLMEHSFQVPPSVDVNEENSMQISLIQYINEELEGMSVDDLRYLLARVDDEFQWRKNRDKEREADIVELAEQKAAIDAEKKHLQKRLENLATMNRQIEQDSEIARLRIAQEERAARKWRHRAAEITSSMDQWKIDREKIIRDEAILETQEAKKWQSALRSFVQKAERGCQTIINELTAKQTVKSFMQSADNKNLYEDEDTSFYFVEKKDLKAPIVGSESWDGLASRSRMTSDGHSGSLSVPLMCVYSQNGVDIVAVAKAGTHNNKAGTIYKKKALSDFSKWFLDWKYGLETQRSDTAKVEIEDMFLTTESVLRYCLNLAGQLSTKAGSAVNETERLSEAIWTKEELREHQAKSSSQNEGSERSGWLARVSEGDLDESDLRALTFLSSEETKRRLEKLCNRSANSELSTPPLSLRLLWLIYSATKSRTEVMKQLDLLVPAVLRGKMSPQSIQSLFSILLQEREGVVKGEEVNIGFRDPVLHAEVWRVIFSSLEAAELSLRHAALHDANSILHKCLANCISISQFEGWQTWVYGILQDLPFIHTKEPYKSVYAFGVNVLNLVHAEYFFNAPQGDAKTNKESASNIQCPFSFMELFISSLEKLYLFGGYTFESCTFASTILQSLLSVLGSRRSDFSTMISDRSIEWSNLVSLLEMARWFVLEAGFWKDTYLGNDGDSRLKHRKFKVEGAQVLKRIRARTEYYIPPTLEKSASKKTDDLNKYGFHWALDGSCADLGVIRAVLLLLRSLDMHTFEKELYPNLNPKEMLFRERLVQEYGFWVDILEFATKLSRSSIDDYKYFTYRKVSHWSKKLTMCTSTERKSIIAELDNFFVQHNKQIGTSLDM